VTNSKKILLIGNVKSKSVQRLRSEAVSMGLLFDMVVPDHVFCDPAGQFDVPWSQPNSVWDYDVYFFRGIGSKISQLQNFIDILKQKSKRVEEECLFEGQGLPEDKYVPESQLGLYKFPKTRTILANELVDVSDQLAFPLVAKKIGLGSSMGRGVSLVKSFAELDNFTKNYNGHLQLQQYHDLKFDTRVLVIGGECIGGFNRYKNGQSFLTTAKGGEREVAILDDVQVRAALEVAKLKKINIAGVDMFYDQDQLFIIEANASPQFMAFEQVTGVNVAQRILKFLNN
jgi:hypothetical protein